MIIQKCITNTNSEYWNSSLLIYYKPNISSYILYLNKGLVVIRGLWIPVYVGVTKKHYYSIIEILYGNILDFL